MVGYNPSEDEYYVELSIFRCPSCRRDSILAKHALRGAYGHDTCHIFPRSNALQFPEYVPEAIRQDYEEACAIVNLSPKASATLSRRCLQSMIRDFWEVSENNLFKEIDAIKDKVPTKQWNVIDGLRRIGNIGAHMERDINLIVDIEPDEATKLLKMIELLINQWYVERHEQERLYADIIDMDEGMQAERRGD